MGKRNFKKKDVGALSAPDTWGAYFKGFGRRGSAVVCYRGFPQKEQPAQNRVGYEIETYTIDLYHWSYKIALDFCRTPSFQVLSPADHPRIRCFQPQIWRFQMRKSPRKLRKTCGTTRGTRGKTRGTTRETCEITRESIFTRDRGFGPAECLFRG